MIRLCFFLYVVGLSMVCLEVFIPGGITGAAGVVSIGASFWFAYTKVGSVFGSYFVAAGLVIAMVCIFLSVRLFPRTRFSERLFLRSDERGFKSVSEELEFLEGEEGVALTKLRPAGMARIGGKKVSVVTEGIFVDKGVKIKVLEVEGSRVVVRKIASPAVREPDGQETGTDKVERRKKK